MLHRRVTPATCSLLLLVSILSAAPLRAQTTPGSECRLFQATGKQVCGAFLAHWDAEGGLAQQGYPISGEFQEKSDTDGKTYTVQYFERAVFELHPENKAPYDVLLSLLGNSYYKQKYPNGAPSQQANNSPGSILFKETGHHLGGKFLAYWNSHGGLAQQGFPISEEFQEKSDLNGKTYMVQYFERAVFEYHPENQPPNDVLLSQLGTLRFKSKYPSGEPPTGGATPMTTPLPTPAGDVWTQLASRPLTLPALSPDGRCQASTGKIVSPDYGAALGDGPVYAVGFTQDGKVDLAGALRDAGGFYMKVLWIARPGYTAPTLVRGAQLSGSGPGVVRFGDGESPSDQLRLSIDSAGSSASGWHDWPTHTRLPGSGCYAYQLDSPGSSQLIIFWAIQTMP